MLHFQLSVVETKSLLSVMKQICENHYNDFDIDLTNNLVQFAKNEMIKSSDSQFSASDILITLGRGRSDQVNYTCHYYQYIHKHYISVYINNVTVLYTI